VEEQQMTSLQSITIPVTFGALHDGLRMTTVVPGSLRYCLSDPYAVVVRFHMHAIDPLEWYLARDSLARGLKVAVALGDVQITPASNGTDLYVNFPSPASNTALRLHISVAAAFLDRTYEMVPEGTESDHLDLDDLVAQLLAH
jgi:hypothetical protein